MVRALISAMQDRTNPIDYRGADRRRHKVYVTHNTEYHTRDQVCVAVMDRRTGQFVPNHKALGHKMTGSLHTPKFSGDFPFRNDPEPGDQVVFDNGMKHHVITSELERVTRPPPQVVKLYS